MLKKKKNPNVEYHYWTYTLRKLLKDTCTPMFIVTTFTIAKIWKQPRYPLAGECIEKLWYIYKMQYYSVIKRKKN